MHRVESMTGGTAKPVNAPFLSDLSDGAAPGPMGGRQLPNRKNFSIVGILTRNSIDDLDFISTQNEAISRHQSKHANLAADRYAPRRIANRLII
jgi:hypothetical protein